MSEANTKRGAVQTPLASGLDTLLEGADPFLFHAIDFIKAVIETHVGDALLEHAGGTGIRAAVAQAVPMDPTPFLATAHYEFPLVAVYRKTFVLRERTVSWRHSQDTFELLYVLPPLSAADAERVVPVLRAIAGMLDDRLETGSDPAYTPQGGELGDSVLALAHIEKCEMQGGEYGLLPGVLANEVFFALRMRGRVLERAMPVESGMDSFEGANIALDLADPAGVDETAADVVLADTAV